MQRLTQAERPNAIDRFNADNTRNNHNCYRLFFPSLCFCNLTFPLNFSLEHKTTKRNNKRNCRPTRPKHENKLTTANNNHQRAHEGEIVYVCETQSLIHSLAICRCSAPSFSFVATFSTQLHVSSFLTSFRS